MYLPKYQGDMGWGMYCNIFNLNERISIDTIITIINAVKTFSAWEGTHIPGSCVIIGYCIFNSATIYTKFFI